MAVMRAAQGRPDTIGRRMDIIPDKRKVTGLVEAAHEGKICLPNFQRDFVWTREEVADLVRSIIRGYFIASLLLLRCDANNPPFAPSFSGGPSLRAATQARSFSSLMNRLRTV